MFVNLDMCNCNLSDGSCTDFSRLPCEKQVFLLPYHAILMLISIPTSMGFGVKIIMTLVLNNLKRCR